MFTIITAVGSKNVDESHPDSSIHGAYLVKLSNDVPLERIASASLDGFHEDFGIKILDDFVISVFDYDTGVVIPESEGIEPYDSSIYCTSVEFISHDTDLAKLIRGGAHGQGNEPSSVAPIA